MVVLISVAAMLCKSAIDLIGNKTIRNSKGDVANTYYFFQTATMLALLLLMFLTRISSVQFDLKSITYGIVVGIFSYFSYLLFVYSLKGKSGSIYITIYRLNFIISSILGIIILNEKITTGKILGGIFCLIAITLFVNWGEFKQGKTDKFLIYSLLASLLIGVANVLNKTALNSGITSDTLLTHRYFIVFILIIADFKIRNIKIKIGEDSFPRKLVAYSAASGAILLLSLYLFFYALKIGDITIVTPIVQSCFIFTSAFCFIFFKEKFSLRKLIGMLFAVLCIIFIGL